MKINSFNKKIFLTTFWLFIVLVFLSINSTQKKLNKLPRDNAHTWLTASTVKFVENWIEDGAVNLGFRMYELPDSIDSHDLDHRDLYVSYPVGCIIPIWAATKCYSILKGKNLTTTGIIKIIRLYSILTHAILGCCIFLICWIYLKKKIDWVYAVLLSLISVYCVYAFNYSSYYHFFVYFADQSVMWLFSLSILLELLKKENSNKKYLLAIETGLFFVNLIGLSTDWLFYFYMFTIFVKRIVFKEFGNYKNAKTYLKIAFYCIPVIIASGLFLYQILSATTISALIRKLKFRTNDTSSYSGFWLKNVAIHIINGYGILYLLLFEFSIGYYIYRVVKSIKNKKQDDFVMFYSILLVPCLFQICFFRNHSAIHEFSVLKLELPLSFFITICMLEFFPKLQNYTLNLNVENGITERILKIPVLLFAVIFIAVISVGSQEIKYKMGSDYNYDREIFIKNNTSFNDILFSFDYEIRANPPHSLAYSRKIVHKINEKKEIDSFREQTKFHDARYLIFVSNVAKFSNESDFIRIAEEDDYALFEYRKD